MRRKKNDEAVQLAKIVMLIFERSAFNYSRCQSLQEVLEDGDDREFLKVEFQASKTWVKGMVEMCNKVLEGEK